VLTDAEIRDLERDNVRAALRQAGGKIYGAGGAAELLGLRPTTLASRMKALGIRVEKGSG
jgi:transcriptional regulator with GAF, ATPase, and Fis domain